MKINKTLASTLGTAAVLGITLLAGTTSASADTTVTVKSGDTVSEIAQAYNSTISGIEKANNLTNDLIYVGDQLTVPTDDDATTTTSTSSQQTTGSYTPSYTYTPSTTSSYNTNSNSSAASTSSNSSSASTKSYSNTAATSSSNNSSSTSTSSTSSSSVGSSVSSVASAMAAKTGVSASTWQRIIMRESGGNGNISNASSGAYGYFQLLGHGEHSGMSAAEQVNMAASVYEAQGMAAWGE
ncbi:LysM peptidoglycan-binding domain-containing protein [Levilactobacillus bambusae]|uniref:Peptidoglycan-binding protein LysM n=1 Tax=Levilactobacillus bambusae TaxID=2024736 RepID=A0A2V1N0A2_9LACO|nr:LysM peptidoglycan-binding domain-containing protein [Levilactobacillus bambusae]PWF99854.1 peptidoglycan-binding protein LysM [Levilactobacillus bambusae]